MPLENIEEEGGGSNPFDGQGAQAQFPVLSRELGRRTGPYQSALQARQLADREHIAAQTMDIRSQQVELEKIKELSALETERLKIADTMEAHRQTMKAASAVAALDTSAPDYNQKVLQIGADYPLGVANETIQKAITFRNGAAERQQTFQNQLDMEKQRQSDILERQKQSEDFRQKAMDEEQANIKARKDAPLSTEQDLQKSYGITSTDLLNPVYKERGTFKPTSDDKSDGFTGSDTGNMLRFTVNDGKGGNKKVLIPRDDYLSHLGTLAGTNPVARKQLAEEAANDPAASDEHKAAAISIGALPLQ
jgi:hypothetical protein